MVSLSDHFVVSVSCDPLREIIGSYDSFHFGCLGDEFYDVMHPKLECMSKVFSKAR